MLARRSPARDAHPGSALALQDSHSLLPSQATLIQSRQSKQPEKDGHLAVLQDDWLDGRPSKEGPCPEGKEVSPICGSPLHGGLSRKLCMTWVTANRQCLNVTSKAGGWAPQEIAASVFLWIPSLTQHAACALLQLQRFPAGADALPDESAPRVGCTSYPVTVGLAGHIKYLQNLRSCFKTATGIS